MPKLPPMSARELIRALIALGFIEDHQTGSHRVFYHSGSGKRAVVAYHLGDIPKGTLSSVLREAGIDR